MDTTAALHWFKDYCLMNDETARKRIRFVNVNRSYIINYNYGMELIGDYVKAKGGGADNPAKTWDIFGELLSSPALPADLLKASSKQ
jgi:hypothetical protein